MTIFSDDPKALEKLYAKLTKLETERAYWKTVKKCVPRRYDNSDEDKKWYMPQNISQNIRSVKQRIAKLESLKESNTEMKREYFYRNGTKMFKYVEVKQN